MGVANNVSVVMGGVSYLWALLGGCWACCGVLWCTISVGFWWYSRAKAFEIYIRFVLSRGGFSQFGDLQPDGYLAN